MPIPMSESPCLSVAIDLIAPFPTGETLLILVDYYSRFLFVGILKSTTSANIISKLFKMFSVHGLPEILTSTCAENKNENLCQCEMKSKIN